MSFILGQVHGGANLWLFSLGCYLLAHWSLVQGHRQGASILTPISISFRLAKLWATSFPPSHLSKLSEKIFVWALGLWSYSYTPVVVGIVVRAQVYCLALACDSWSPSCQMP